MPMKEDEFKNKKSFLYELFIFYSDMYEDRRASGVSSKEDLDAVMRQIDTVLDWYNELKKENTLWKKMN